MRFLTFRADLLGYRCCRRLAFAYTTATPLDCSEKAMAWIIRACFVSYSLSLLFFLCSINPVDPNIRNFSKLTTQFRGKRSAIQFLIVNYNSNNVRNYTKINIQQIINILIYISYLYSLKIKFVQQKVGCINREPVCTYRAFYLIRSKTENYQCKYE